jgi:predicted branched-subunit amino acid permease
MSSTPFVCHYYATTFFNDVAFALAVAEAAATNTTTKYILCAMYVRCYINKTASERVL